MFDVGQAHVSILLAVSIFVWAKIVPPYHTYLPTAPTRSNLTCPGEIPQGSGEFYMSVQRPGIECIDATSYPHRGRFIVRCNAVVPCVQSRSLVFPFAMVAKAHKHSGRRNAFATTSAKRGKARHASRTWMKAKATIQKKPSIAHKNPYVPYVRHGDKTEKSRLDREKPLITLKQLWKASDKELLDRLREDGFLPDMKGAVCHKCGNGRLGSLVSCSCRGWCYKCAKCKGRTMPQDHHPMFNKGSGQQQVPLCDQAAVLLCAIQNVSQVKCHELTGMGHKVVERIYGAFETVICAHVEKTAKKVVFGGLQQWVDVEADECDVRRGKNVEDGADSNAKVIWEQWCGIVQRGAASTLVLTKLNPKKTGVRAPGPGAIRKQEWTVLANRHLKNRNVILHTDGAKSYRQRIEGMLHDWAVHQKKLVVLGGVQTWLKPKYSVIKTHTLPDGTVLRVKTGSQIIDRFWNHLRSFMKSRSRATPGSHALRRRLRVAQWTYWHRSKKLWSHAGKAIKSFQ